MMRMSETGKQRLIEWEGLRLHGYADAVGVPTLGVGHVLSRAELTSGTILIQGQPIPAAHGLTRQQALDLLDQDLARVETLVNDCVTVPLTPPQFDTLVAFAFNVGATAFRGSTLLARLNQGQYAEVPAQLRRWVRAAGREVAGLKNRRELEIKQWHERREPI